MLNILADYQAAGGILGTGVLLTLVMVVYAIVCSFVPFTVGAIMHNTKYIHATLRRIEKLLETRKE